MNCTDNTGRYFFIYYESEENFNRFNKQINFHCQNLEKISLRNRIFLIQLISRAFNNFECSSSNNNKILKVKKDPEQGSYLLMTNYNKIFLVVAMQEVVVEQQVVAEQPELAEQQLQAEQEQKPIIEDVYSPVDDVEELSLDQPIVTVDADLLDFFKKSIQEFTKYLEKPKKTLNFI